MSVTLLAALLLQAIALVLLRHRLRGGWLRRPGTLILLASVAYQGLFPVLMTLRSVRAQNIYTAGIRPEYTDSATLLLSAGMLAFTIAYLLCCGDPVIPDPSREQIQVAVQALNWRWLACVLAPLAFLTYQGRGYNDAVATGPASTLSSDLASMFFILLVALTAFSFLLKHGTKFFLPVLTAQSLLLAAAGERTPVAVEMIALVALLARAGQRPSGQQLRIALVLTIVATLAITGVRLDQGRSLYYADTGLSARVTALGGGLTTLGGKEPDLVTSVALRLDGVDFAGGILQAEALGHRGLSARYVPGSLLILIPSFIWPAKLAYGALNPTLTELNDFGMQKINFLPGFAGLYTGFLPAPLLVLFLALGGLACGLGERSLFRRCTPVRLVFLAGAVNCALGYEQGLPGMLAALRAAGVIAAFIKLTEVVRGRRAGQQHHRRDVAGVRLALPAPRSSGTIGYREESVMVRPALAGSGNPLDGSAPGGSA